MLCSDAIELPIALLSKEKALQKINRVSRPRTIMREFRFSSKENANKHRKRRFFSQLNGFDNPLTLWRWRWRRNTTKRYRENNEAPFSKLKSIPCFQSTHSIHFLFFIKFEGIAQDDDWFVKSKKWIINLDWLESERLGAPLRQTTQSTLENSCLDLTDFISPESSGNG